MKKRVTILCGARSTEHEVSLVSAYNIVNAIDRDKYEVSVVGISKEGEWRQYDPDNFVENGDMGVGHIVLSSNTISGRLAIRQCSNEFYDIDNNRIAVECDVIFPAVLGAYAEDGTMQGLLRMMDIPFTTPDVLGSAVGMDKDVAYRLLRDAGINIANFITLRKNYPVPTFEELAETLGTTMIFIKPSNAGSSVGVSKVTSQTELDKALKLAFAYDVKVIAQAMVVGREIEISVSGNFGNQKTSLAGEIVERDSSNFYSYENKYVNISNVELHVPADITNELQEKISKIAIQVCETLECEGFGRVDFFVDHQENVYVNEINTMPGFTNASMFPRLWGASGVNYSDLISWLIELAMERQDYRVAPIVTDAEDIKRAANETVARF